MTHNDATTTEAAGRRLHGAYVSKVNEAQEQDNDQRATELADDYVAQMRTLRTR